MECIICGRTETDFEKDYNEISEKIGKTLEIIKDKKKKAPPNGDELKEINGAMRALIQQKATFLEKAIPVDKETLEKNFLQT
jgi:hypothetical protein